MLSINTQIKTIFVATNAEATAVKRGLKKLFLNNIQVICIPMGVKSLKNYLATMDLPPQPILVLGLGGSLDPKYSLGDLVLYENCLYQPELGELMRKSGDPQLNELIYHQLQPSVSLVTGLTCDRLITTTTAKQKLKEVYLAEVVDMESFTILSRFPQVAILRVISDNCQQTLPDLNQAIDSQGKLKTIPMLKAMTKQPLAGAKLIYSSLISLNILTQTTYKLFKQE